MALVPQIEALIRERYLNSGKLQENFFADIPVFHAIAKKTNISGGESIQQRIRYKGLAAGSVKGYSQLDTFPTELGDFATKAKWEWRNIVASIVMAGEDMRKANTKEDMINFVDEHVETALLEAKEYVRNRLILSTGTGAYVKDPDGFAIAFGDGVLPYGNIVAADFAGWVAQRYTAALNIAIPTATNLTLLKRKLVSDVQDKASAGSKPTTILTTRDIYDKLYEYAMSKSYIVTMPKTARGKKLVELGFDCIELDGVPMIVDTEVPAGHAYSWSDKNLWLQIHPKANFSTLPDGNGKQQSLEKINRMDAYACDLVIMCNLVCPERRALAVCTNIVTV